MKALNQLKTFQRILQEYPGDTPLGKFLPGFYRQNKQMGSNDRRVAGRLVYNYFRLGQALQDLPADERLVVAEFLCNTQTNSFLQHFKPEWAACADLPPTKKVEMVKQFYPDFHLNDVFPWTDQLSASVDREAFLLSFFTQPDLFIRMRKGFETYVKAELTKAGIIFKDDGDNCLAMPNGTRLENIFPSTQNWFEVQDASSQQTARLFKPNKWDAWWDACAASGGKSLLLHELEPNLRLVVSDIRGSILNNLDERFQRSGLVKYQKKQLDLTANIDPELANYIFDGIILDAPCSGSGTWGRTPEMIAQFSKGKIDFFNRLQSDIVRNVVKYLKPGKPLIYITCSAFKAENEDVVRLLSEEIGFNIEHQGIIKGYEHKADTMFAARLIKPA